MKPEPRDVLRDLLRERGSELETNPQRVRALLSDLCPECRKEINLIIQAQQIEIPRRLKLQTAQISVAVVLPALSRLMEEHYGTSPEPARWAVETWVVALGMALPAAQPVSPVPVTTQPIHAPVTPQPVAPPINPAAAIASSTFWSLPYGEPMWVEIPAGEFWMGGERYDAEKPIHKLHLERYWIAKTPITNAQYRFFVEATQRAAPSYWENGKVPRGLENHPVVNVTWYDALAYCEWLAKITGKAITLPSEAEWEKAARGDRDKREYPWGDIFDKNKCNTVESGIKGTTPVGKYSPAGDSLSGCADMAGNVWEWTVSLWGKDWQKPEFTYPYRPGDGRENLKAGDDVRRVLRGGSFDYSQLNARCSYRHWLNPNLRGRLGSFRVVVAPSRA